MTAKSFLLQTLGFMLASALLVAGLNAFIDPYAITGAPRMAGLNEHKILVNDHIRLMKKYHPLQKEHNALIAGNSRVEIGLDPAHQCFKDLGMEVYNVAIPGATVRLQLAYALNIIYQQPVDTVILSADFTDFAWTEPPERFHDTPMVEESVAGFKLSSGGEPNPDYTHSRFLEYFKALFSLDSLTASVNTLLGQTADGPDRDESGFNPARDFAKSIRIEGPQALFELKFNELNRYFFKKWYMRDGQGRIDTSFDDLEAFLDITTERGIEVHLLINPFHQSYLNHLEKGGHVQLYEEWFELMKLLVSLYPPELVSFWDFSVDSPYIHEPVPTADGQSEPLTWFWEPSHYRKELGNKMIDTMLAERCDTEAAFGRKVR